MQDGIVLRRAAGSRRAWRLAAAIAREWGDGRWMRRKLPHPDHGECGGASHFVDRLDRRGRAELGLDRSRRRQSGRGVRGVHALQRRAQLPRPEPRGRIAVPGDCWHRSLIARVQGGQAKCRRLLPGGGPPGPGSATHPSAQTLAKLLKIAQCMRQHGISQFPDPRTSVPLNPFGSGYGVITDYDGAILLFPSTIDMADSSGRRNTRYRGGCDGQGEGVGSESDGAAGGAFAGAAARGPARASGAVLDRDQAWGLDCGGGC